MSAHPDLLLFKVGGEILTYRAYYEANRALLDALSLKVVPIDRDPSGRYPHDVALDALAVGDTLYGLRGAVAPEVVARYQHVRDVKQGYTRCSVAMLTPRAAITADRGIARALRADGIEVLPIRPGHIALPGYDTGFIGGAGGDLGGGRYGFFGDWRTHPDGEAIEAFAAAHGVTLIALEDRPLRDYGGLLLLP